MILFAASPLSNSSFRLMVIVVFKRGGSPRAGEFAGAFGAAAPEEAGGGVEPSWVRSLEIAAGGCSFPPLAGGSRGSAADSWTGRPTSPGWPAQFGNAPASPQTSRHLNCPFPLANLAYA